MPKRTDLQRTFLLIDDVPIGRRVRSMTLICLIFCVSVAASRAATPPSRSQFQARANSLCAHYFSGITAIRSRTHPHDLPSLAIFQRQAHARAVVFVSQLKLLTPPVAAASTFRRYVVLNVESNGFDEPIIAAAERGDLTEVNRLLASEASLDRPILKAASQLSLRVCANPPR